MGGVADDLPTNSPSIASTAGSDYVNKRELNKNGTSAVFRGKSGILCLCVLLSCGIISHPLSPAPVPSHAEVVPSEQPESRDTDPDLLARDLKQLLEKSPQVEEMSERETPEEDSSATEWEEHVFSNPSPPYHVKLENARIMTTLAGYTDFLHDFEHNPRKPFCIAGYGSIYSINSVKTFCGNGVIEGWGRMAGAQRQFALPSARAIRDKWGTLEKGNVAVLSAKATDDPDVRQPLVAVVGATLDCVPDFLWREFSYALRTDVEVQMVKVSDEGATETKETRKCWAVLQSDDAVIKWKYGYFMYRNILSTLPIENRDQALAKKINAVDQSLILELCSNPQWQREGSKPEVSLQTCFSSLLKKSMLLTILGSRVFHTRYVKTGLNSLWNVQKPLLPAPVYLRCILCAARKESPFLFAAFLHTTYLNDGRTTVYEKMKSDKSLAEIPPGFEIPPRYSDAGTCNPLDSFHIAEEFSEPSLWQS